MKSHCSVIYSTFKLGHQKFLGVWPASDTEQSCWTLLPALSSVWCSAHTLGQVNICPFPSIFLSRSWLHTCFAIQSWPVCVLRCPFCKKLMVQTDQSRHKDFTPFLPQVGPWEMSFGSQDTGEIHLTPAPLTQSGHRNPPHSCSSALPLVQ